MEETHEQLQASVLSWGNLLIATGGLLKPAKCFYHIISFDWMPDGIWRYANNEDREDLQIMVPQPEDTLAAIAHLGVSEASQTLGSMSAPSGDPTSALMRVKEKAQGWIDTAKNAKLSQRHLWFLADRQFWPKVGFGVGMISASFEELTICLHRQYYQLLPLGGIRRSVPKEVRYLGRGFYGSGCPHLGIECLVKGLDKRLTHYGCSTVVGKNLQIAMEFLIIEVRLSIQIFQLDYKKYHFLAMDCWLKLVWEKIIHFGLHLTLRNVNCQPPQGGDDWIMTQFLQLGYPENESSRLNRVRLHQQVLFVSDVMDAGGQAIDRKYMSRRLDTQSWNDLHVQTSNYGKLVFCNCAWVANTLRQEYRVFREVVIKCGIGDMMRRVARFCI